MAVALTGGWSSPVFLLYYPALALAAPTRKRAELALAGFATAAYLAVLAATGWNASAGELAFRLLVLGASVRFAGSHAREVAERTSEHAWALRQLEERAAELEQLAAEKEFLALHDPLTGLPNRMLLDDRLRQALVAAERDGAGAGILVVDLDGFKDVNDSHGHPVGDAVLRQIGPRLSRDLRRFDTVARIGGDEFAVVLPGLADAGIALRIASDLRAAAAEPFQVGDLRLAIGASIGVALYPAHGTQADTLLNAADQAMYAAKDGRTGVELYRSPGNSLAGEVA